MVPRSGWAVESYSGGVRGGDNKKGLSCETYNRFGAFENALQYSRHQPQSRRGTARMERSTEWTKQMQKKRSYGEGSRCFIIFCDALRPLTFRLSKTVKSIGVCRCRGSESLAECSSRRSDIFQIFPKCQVWREPRSRMRAGFICSCFRWTQRLLSVFMLVSWLFFWRVPRSC